MCYNTRQIVVHYSHFVRKVMRMKLLHQENPNIRLHCRDTLDFPPHLHDVLEVVFVRRGTATALCNGRRYSLKPGDLFLSFPNQAHGYEDSQNIRCDVLILPANPFLAPWRQLLTQNIPAEPVLPPEVWQNTHIPALLDMLRPVRRKLEDAVLQGYGMVIAGLLLPLVPLQSRAAAGNDTMQQLIRYVGEHYREPLTRREVARAVGYNESYISHLFSEQMGTGLTEYITSLRLKDAKELLTDTELTVSQISLILGFGSIRSFNRVFAKAFGMTPSAWRKRRVLSS